MPLEVARGETDSEGADRAGTATVAHPDRRIGPRRQYPEPMATAERSEETRTDASRTVDADYIVFFDGVCVLCHTGMKQLMALDTDGQLHYAQLQGETAKAFGIDWDDDAKPGSQTFVFIDNSGPEPIIHRRMRAVRAELEVIGRLRAVTLALTVIPLPISNLIYRVIAATRYRLWGTYDVCPLPPTRVRSRFLP